MKQIKKLLANLQLKTILYGLHSSNFSKKNRPSMHLLQLFMLKRFCFIKETGVLSQEILSIFFFKIVSFKHSKREME